MKSAQGQDKILFSGKPIVGTITVAGNEYRGLIVTQGEWSVTIQVENGDRYQSPWRTLSNLAYAGD